MTERLIVVGVDGSDDGLRGVRFAAGVAEAFGGELLIVHAVDDGMLAGAWGVVYDPELLQEAGTAATQQAREHALSTTALPAERIRTEVVLGSPGGVLGRLSEVADLVVVGRRSVSGLERMFVGSTSVSVVSQANCPVLVISDAAHPDDIGHLGVIGVGMNTSPGNVATLEGAFRFARLFGAQLEIVHALQPPLGLFAPRFSPKDLDEQIHYVVGGLTSLAQRVGQEFPGVEYRIDVVSDTPLNELVTRSRRYDYLVLGSSERVLPTLGGLMRGLMAHAECPLIVLP